jgi:BirA family biotin operon repressor/biotin-[acetyl-CoA-carboxylase] ligase
MYSEQALRKGLKTSVFGNKIYTFDSLDSTNNCAKAVAGVGALEGTVVVADQQTAGRGRLGRIWESSPGENLMFSVVLRPNITADKLNLLPLYVAVAVSQAIERMTKLKVECKWPNDILVNKKKVAGILIEGSTKQNTVEYVVVGVGINVNQTTFSRDLSAKATSIKLETGRDFDRAKLLREVLTSFESSYGAVAASAFQSVVPLWLSRSTMLNQNISVAQQGNVISGTVKGLSSEGALILQTNGSEKTLYAGDVTIVGM